VAGRLVSRKRGSPPVFSVLGIAVGVLALTVIISVMNGFQLGFIESILEISSYYLRVENAPQGAAAAAFAGELKEIPGVTAVLPFRELQVLLRGGTEQQAAVIRGVPPGAPAADPALAKRLVFEEGAFDLARRGSILLGAELARRLNVKTGDKITLISISSSALTGPQAASSGGEASAGYAGTEGELPLDASFTVRGIFRSGFYEYDLGWGFINFDEAGDMEGEAYTLGIKLADRWQDRKVLSSVEALLSRFLQDSGYGNQNSAVHSWREYNRAFFGALRTEKLFMFVLVGLIFIVVGLNIYQAQRRIVLERREEIGLLRAVGAGDGAVRLIFVWDGFIIGLLGAGTGTALGLLISLNVQAFFSLLENSVNGLLRLVNTILQAVSGTPAAGEGFAVFSPAIFYIKELEGRVIPGEALLIFLFGLFSALGAAWFASGRVSRERPAEVLRYE
jgi:lipoprotein-releasing system permease protein